MKPVYVVLNAGSSSLKFQVFEASGREDPRVVYRGLFEGLGSAPHFLVKDRAGAPVAEAHWGIDERFGHEEALSHLVKWTREHRAGHALAAVGHRVVHGGTAYAGPVLVNESVLQRLEKLEPLAPLHQPHNLEPIRILHRRAPEIPQVACFDTAFHRNQPEIAQLFALPREMTRKGVVRYGFHGLSYEYISSVLASYDPKLAEGRVVVAHLGNGASLCAMSRGASIASTMGFSALDGLPMGTRCGAVDPGVVFYMLRDMKLSTEEAERILYTKSGLLGVSGLSNDMRTLRQHAPHDPDARRAIDLFVYRIAREVGSMVSALGGIDAIVFTAGIGENDRQTRADVLARLAWAGFEPDAAANDRNDARITQERGPAAWIIPTNEELVIARHVHSVVSAGKRQLAS
ncbi:acetate/propionate family kinase [Microvirga thermotolerans]|uniref:Acetate kinase n=1 Tax=Microvirga thermotolerans TaxID=2651334 RepID=A0A5P9JPU4_9HYPH|nr:acetate/propionate family kinase [Microvirga thermotolerans]QFU14792.1 acetate/propionate family kinase [Microvirga thermotolerans]